MTTLKNLVLASTASLLCMAGTAHAACVETEKTASKEAHPEALARALATQDGTLAFSIAKMSCKSCAAKIRKALKADLGLEDIKIDVETKTVRVGCSAAAGCSKEMVTASLARAGYPVDANP
jgi:copper chaperone